MTKNTSGNAGNVPEVLVQMSCLFQVIFKQPYLYGVGFFNLSPFLYSVKITLSLHWPFVKILPLFAVIKCTLLVRLGASISDGEYYKSSIEETKKNCKCCNGINYCNASVE